MMKTVAQIAREIGVSKQAIHSRIKKEPLKSALSGLTETIDNALHITVDGEQLIRAAYMKFDGEVDKLANTNELVDILKEQIAALTEQNQDLREQLSQERQHSRKQADEIARLAQQGQKLAANAQALHAMANVKRQQLTGGKNEKKRGFFDKLFT